MEVSVRPITLTEELAAVGHTRARRCRARAGYLSVSSVCEKYPFYAVG